MWRNDIKHSYRSINNSGIIISDFVSDIPPVEIVVKRFCEGTDKHSFHQILNYQNILQIDNNYEYLSGPYVRFDWRNPNHISPNTKEALNNNPFYYLHRVIKKFNGLLLLPSNGNKLLFYVWIVPGLVYLFMKINT